MARICVTCGLRTEGGALVLDTMTSRARSSGAAGPVVLDETGDLELIETFGPNVTARICNPSECRRALARVSFATLHRFNVPDGVHLRWGAVVTVGGGEDVFVEAGAWANTSGEAVPLSDAHEASFERVLEADECAQLTLTLGYAAVGGSLPFLGTENVQRILASAHLI